MRDTLLAGSDDAHHVDGEADADDIGSKGAAIGRLDAADVQAELDAGPRGPEPAHRALVDEARADVDTASARIGITGLRPPL